MTAEKSSADNMALSVLIVLGYVLTGWYKVLVFRDY